MDGISVNIKAGLTAANSAVTAVGTVAHPITATERSAYGIDDGSLIGAVGRSAGDDFVIKLWLDGVNPVLTTVTAQSAEILSVASAVKTVATRSFVNNSSVKATFDCSTTEEVSDTMESNWSETGGITVTQEFEYGVSILGAGGEGTTSISYSHSWGQGGSQSKGITLGSNQGVTVDLEPGKGVKATLVASRGVLKVRVTYLASVAGTVSYNRAVFVDLGRVYTIDLVRVMNDANIATSCVITEDLEVGYYTDAKIILTDSAGNVQKVVALSQPMAQA